MQMQYTLDLVIGVNNDDRGDAAVLHDRERGSGTFVGMDSAGDVIADFGGGFVQRAIALVLEEATQVTIADDAEEGSVDIDYGGHAETLFAHLVDNGGK